MLIPKAEMEGVDGYDRNLLTPEQRRFEMNDIKGIDELKNDDISEEILEILEDEALLGEVPPEDTEVSDSKDKIRFEDGDVGLEAMADEVHQVWCMWMEYMFSKGLVQQDRGFKINPAEFARWRRQMVTPYAQLSENEKQSDRDIARRYLNIAWAPQGEGRTTLTELELWRKENVTDTSDERPIMTCGCSFGGADIEMRGSDLCCANCGYVYLGKE